MKSHRTIISTGGLLVALVVALPGAAQASSLLSGYGGPGQGNQAILGSALVNGPRGGGGGGSGGASEPSSGSSTTGAEAESSSPASGAGRGGTSEPSGSSGAGKGASGKRHGAARRAAGKQAQDGAGEASSTAAGFYPASERIPAGEPGALGLSGADLIFVILAVGTLVFTGVLTRRFSRTTAAGRHR
jgi:hypothetical protein